MFDIEKTIAEWRKQMLKAGVNTPEPLEELELHLRDQIEEIKQSGVADREAFLTAVERIGKARAIASEFEKVEWMGWGWSLTGLAWAMYAVSFFLRSYNDGPGWACAALQGYFWNGVLEGNWGSINYELLTLANLVMLASPVLAYKFPANGRVHKWTAWLMLASIALIVSFLSLLLREDYHSAHIGCYLWAASFIVMYAAILARQKGSKSAQLKLA